MKALMIVGVLLALFTLTTPSFARADSFTGHWVGTGHMTGLMSGDCSKIDVVIDQSADKIVVTSYDAACGVASSSWGPDTMNLQGSKVFDQGDEIGTYSQDTLTTSQTEDGVAYAFNLKLQPADASGKSTLHCEYGVQNYAGTMLIEGDLEQQ